MIPLDRVKACGNVACRLVLPADLDNESFAGFWVAARDPSGRARRWQSWCQDCTRAKTREAAGIRRRGKAYSKRVPQDRELRARRQTERLQELKRLHAERMATDPQYVIEHHRKDCLRAKRRAEQQREELRRDRRRRLPAPPFAQWLRERSAEVGGMRALSGIIGVHEDQIRRLILGHYWSHGKRYEVKNVTLDLPDRALMLDGRGTQLCDLWPELGEG
jgi:hypothetical protein